MTETERLDFMLSYWGKYSGGVYATCGDDSGSEDRIEWEGWDSYGRHGHFITFAATKREAIDLAIAEAKRMRREDWEKTWPEWMLTHADKRRRVPDNVTPYEEYQRRQDSRSPISVQASPDQEKP